MSSLVVQARIRIGNFRTHRRRFCRLGTGGLALAASLWRGALDRTQTGLPLEPGKCGTLTHDDEHHGATTLFAAFSALDRVLPEDRTDEPATLGPVKLYELVPAALVVGAVQLAAFL
jgi:hypothetical protein